MLGPLYRYQLPAQRHSIHGPMTTEALTQQGGLKLLTELDYG